MCCKYLCIFSVFIYALCMCQNFWRNCFNLRFKIDAVVMIIWSIVIIINSVLTLQVLTASLTHDREPCEIKVVSNHTCSLHTCVCAGSHRVRVRLSGFRRQGISSTPGGFLKSPIPVRVCAEQKSIQTLAARDYCTMCRWQGERVDVHQRLLNVLQSTRISRHLMNWLLPHPLSCQQVVSGESWGGGGMGEEPIHSRARKPGPLYIIYYYLLAGLLGIKFSLQGN